MAGLWQLDRVSPGARAAAESAAQAAGLPLSQWLGRMVVDTAAAEGVMLAPEPLPPPPRPIPTPAAAPSMPPITRAAPARPVMAPPRSGIEQIPRPPAQETAFDAAT